MNPFRSCISREHSAVLPFTLQCQRLPVGVLRHVTKLNLRVASHKGRHWMLLNKSTVDWCVWFNLF